MSEFLTRHPQQGLVKERSALIFKAAQTLMQMSKRQDMTVTEMRAQTMVLRTWLEEIERALAPTEPDQAGGPRA